MYLVIFILRFKSAFLSVAERKSYSMIVFLFNCVNICFMHFEAVLTRGIRIYNCHVFIINWALCCCKMLLLTIIILCWFEIKFYDVNLISLFNGYIFLGGSIPCPMDRGAWWTAVHGVAKSQTWLSHFTSLHLFNPHCSL